MSKLTLEFRAQLKTLALADGWKATRNSLGGFHLERRPMPDVLHQVHLNPTGWYQSEEGQRFFCLSCWAYVAFEQIESRISELLGSAGHDIQITDRRTTSFPLSSVLKKDDPACLLGYPLKTDLSAPEQALDFWSYFSARMAPALDPLSSPECLAIGDYMPPFTSPVTWGTRRVLWNGIAGRVEAATKIAEYVERIAPTDLTSSARQLQSLAASRGQTFLAAPGAFDYISHPRWLEFEVVRNHVARIA